MMRAIERARDGSPLFIVTSRTNGLRAIRTFEEVNGIEFDPLDERHLSKVSGMGPHEGLFRSLRLRKLIPPRAVPESGEQSSSIKGDR